MKKLILIVEDDCDVSLSMAEVLESEGYSTAIAANGCEAIAQLAMGCRPNAILLDMMMPVMDGWKFREKQLELREAASIPVVTLTADGDARGKASSIRADGYAAKPVTVDRLLDEIERVCGPPDA